MLRRLLSNSSLVSRLRVPISPASAALLQNPTNAAGSWSGYGLLRRMSQASLDGINEKEALDRVLMIVKAHPKVNPAKLNPDSHFINDLGLDSLDVVEIVMGFEEEFGLHIPDEEADKMVSVPASVDFVAKHPMSK